MKYALTIILDDGKKEAHDIQTIKKVEKLGEIAKEIFGKVSWQCKPTQEKFPFRK